MTAAKRSPEIQAAEDERRLQARWTAEALLAGGELAAQLVAALQKHPPVERIAWSIAEAAERIGLGRTKVEELVSAARLPSRRLDGRVLILDEDLRAYMQALPLNEGRAAS